MAAIFILSGSIIFPQSDEEVRKIYCDAGLGIGGIIYSENIYHKGIHPAGAFEASAGWALPRELQNLYIVASFTFFGDADLGSKIDSNKLSYSTTMAIGARLYPLSSKKELQLGADIGYSRLWLRPGLPANSGLGLKISAAYDFATNLTGRSMLLGTDIMILTVQKNFAAGFTVFIKAVLK